GTTLAVFTPGLLEGAYGTLTVNAGGAFIYALRGDDDDLHALREGETVFEHFTYAATDGAFISPADVVVTILGRNDAPVANDDFASVQEDLVLTASGNLLANDSDADAGTTLSVTPGTFT